MQALQPRFTKVKSHVEALGAEVEVTWGSRLALPFRLLAELVAGGSFPPKLNQFRSQVGSGFGFRWRLGSRVDDLRYGGFQLMGMFEAASRLRLRKKDVLYTNKEADDYGFPYTNDPEVAKKTAARMWKFVPVIEFGNGDAISIDKADNDSVVFDQHDWMDGGTGDNGIKIGKTWDSFIEEWAIRCFQSPKNGHWPSVISSDGIDWESEQFDQRFRIE
jgi:hypothetical protein